jgi:hypothetical protein
VAVPIFLTHYYEKATGPFQSLSDLPMEQAEALLDGIRREGRVFASQRKEDYLAIRRELEGQIRSIFLAKGGQPGRLTPHYLILGACPWLKAWYREGCEAIILLRDVDPQMVSFTYGDSFPAMRYQDGRPYRGQVYTLAEIPGVICKYGLPQEWNPDGLRGPERYIEAQVWDDGPVQRFLSTMEP